MNRTLRILSICAILMTIPDSLFSAAFQTKTMRSDMPLTEVERALVLGKGWLEFGFDYSAKFTMGAFDDSYRYKKWDNGTLFSYHTAKLEINYGITRNCELYIHLPYLIENLRNDFGTNTTSYGFGDMNAGWLFQIYRSAPDKELVSIATRLFMKGPSGEESPGTYFGGPLDFSRFINTTACYNLGGGIEGKMKFHHLALQLKGGYITKFSSDAMYVADMVYRWTNGRIDPGDEIYGSIGILNQLTRLICLGLDFDASYHFKTRIGTSSSRPIPSMKLDPVEGSEGLFLFAYPRIVLNLKQCLDLHLFGGVPIIGRNSDLFWPIEELSPSAGYTAGVNLYFRY